MRIELENAGKRFNREWIFRNLGLHLNSGDSIAILGGNGSGKSTLLRVLAGYFSLSEGKRSYWVDETLLDEEELYHHISIAAPYLDLPGLFTLQESIAFHFRFKDPAEGISLSEMPAILGLEKHLHKDIRHFSSGMKQRLKLGLAICSATPLLFLDEPASNLDAQAVEWYRKLLQRHLSDRIVVVASNHDEREFDFCREKIELTALKAAQV